MDLLLLKMQRSYSPQIYIAASIVSLIGLGALFYKNFNNLKPLACLFTAELRNAIFLATIIVILLIWAVVLFFLGVKKARKPKDIRYR